MVAHCVSVKNEKFPNFSLLGDELRGSTHEATTDLDTNAILFDGLCGIDRDLIVSLITVFDAQVIVLDVQVEVGQDQLKSQAGT